ncbi:hypothetical protein I6F14_05115 [Bradyrhizobium sp. IC3069]|uniref:Pentapeptide MXKDX repeat protein n=1 Tax=Bradyrhizobium yuanmingense TaxID=108015 RepID=A0A0R3CNZ3_9BRAD|nr:MULTISPECIES: hypothetical protein [Bradyrhizobium]KRP99450.1 hypothetical protein AOQ72_13090 [Bradyrhizobium yuanmingense]MCA1359213.1 hypothetical protein [Bradyrhizobium sp. IC4059]MCA1374070.1 hypothetical protein [Bradyrhizobium sp. IC4060]MCA1391332.1 hypothetical protein [Bradyrhizobium sp. IC3123]MCA1425008.1 hypothetical protein [Bradyrhizobium sp. NBAIM16]
MKKLATIATAAALAVTSTIALAQGGGGAGSAGVDRTNNSMANDAGKGGPKTTTGAGKTSGSKVKSSTDHGEKTGEKLRGQ